MDKGRGSEWVPLLDAVEAIQMRHDGDLAKARQIVKDADRVGNLEVRLLRPDDSTDQLRDVIANLWDNPDLWEGLFRTGLFDAPARATRWRIQDRRSMRRVRPDERCRVVVTRVSLEKFMETMPPAATTNEARAIEHLKGLLEHGDMRKADAQKECEKFKLPFRAFRDRVWPQARKLAKLPPATAGAKRKSTR
jgi:hypothetical protein